MPLPHMLRNKASRARALATKQRQRGVIRSRTYLMSLADQLEKEADRIEKRTGGEKTEREIPVRDAIDPGPLIGDPSSRKQRATGMVS